MRRGLKETIGVCSVATKQGCRPLPDEEGTESQAESPRNVFGVSCRPLPDEEGTESRERSTVTHVPSPVADRSPMRRGLKGIRATDKVREARHGCRPLPDEEGTESIKMAHFAYASSSCRPLPDEEGTERLEIVPGGQAGHPVADRSPMRRGLKVQHQETAGP